jgi:hypothetical protein
VHGAAVAVAVASGRGLVAWRMAYIGVLFFWVVWFCFLLPSAFSAQKAFLCFL